MTTRMGPPASPQPEAEPASDFARYRGRPLRVLHGAYEIAGQGMMLMRALRDWGCEAHCLSYRVDWDGRGGDIVVELDGRSNLGKGAAMLSTFIRWAPYFDVFHFHFGTSVLPRLIDVPLLKRMGKKVVFHFHGCDVRNRSHMIRAHKLSTCTECDPFCRPGRQRWLLDQAARHADQVFYSTMDLAESIPNSSHLPLVTDVERWAEVDRSHPLPDLQHRDGVHGPVVIGHAPTNRLIKGTRYVTAAVERLRSEFPRVELQMIERQPWAELPRLFARCDLLVDQLLMGWYGLMAIEGMATGRPVALYMREEFRDLISDLPVVEADPDTLYDALRGLVKNPERRAELGAQGQEFVRRHHDTKVVGRLLLEIYRRILGA